MMTILHMSCRSDAAASVARMEAKLEAFMTEMRQQQHTISDLRTSLEYTQGVVDTLETTVRQLQKQLGEVSGELQAHRATKPADAADQDSIVLAGLPETTPDVEKHVQSIFQEHMQIDSDVKIVQVSRIGAERSDSAQMPRKLLVKVGDAKQARAVLKAARTLKAYNADAKASGRRPIGLDRNLSFEERQYRSSLWSFFKAAKAEGKKTWWSGHRLFIDGAEVFPTAAHKAASG